MKIHPSDIMIKVSTLFDRRTCPISSRMIDLVETETWAHRDLNEPIKELYQGQLVRGMAAKSLKRTSRP